MDGKYDDIIDAMSDDEVLEALGLDRGANLIQCLRAMLKYMHALYDQPVQPTLDFDRKTLPKKKTPEEFLKDYSYGNVGSPSPSDHAHTWQTHHYYKNNSTWDNRYDHWESKWYGDRK